MPFTFFDAHATIGKEQDVPIDVRELIAIMDEHGIGKAVLSPPHKYIAVDNRVGNELVMEAVRQYPDRFLGYASVNPWYGEKAADELKRAFAAGAVGLKFHPAIQGFYVFDEDKTDSLMRIVESHGAVVYVHTGTPVFALPLQVAELALRYPAVNFIMGRMGNTDFWLDVPEAFGMAANLYVDTPYTAPANIRRLLDIDEKRVLFSADLPYSHPEMERTKIERMDLDTARLSLIARGNFSALFER